MKCNISTTIVDETSYYPHKPKFRKRQLQKIHDKRSIMKGFTCDYGPSNDITCSWGCN